MNVEENVQVEDNVIQMPNIVLYLVEYFVEYSRQLLGNDCHVEVLLSHT